jgi:hypothetical protein
MGTSSLRAGTRRGRAGSARRGIGLAACCDSRRQGNSRAQGLLVAKLTGGAAIVAALGAGEGLQRHDELTRRGEERERGRARLGGVSRGAARANPTTALCREERGERTRVHLDGAATPGGTQRGRRAEVDDGGAPTRLAAQRVRRARTRRRRRHSDGAGDAESEGEARRSGAGRETAQESWAVRFWRRRGRLKVRRVGLGKKHSKFCVLARGRAAACAQRTLLRAAWAARRGTWARAGRWAKRRRGEARGLLACSLRARTGWAGGAASWVERLLARWAASWLRARGGLGWARRAGPRKSAGAGEKRPGAGPRAELAHERGLARVG